MRGLTMTPIRALATGLAAVLVVSVELDEILSLADRVPREAPRFRVFRM